MCTAPNKYTVVDPEGSIKPQCCIDIVVRHNATTPSNCNVTDKFRIQMQDYTTKQVTLNFSIPFFSCTDICIRLSNFGMCFGNISGHW